MRFKEFEMFGVKCYWKGEWHHTCYCETLAEAIEYARDRGSAGYTYKFITCDKWGCEIQEL